MNSKNNELVTNLMNMMGCRRDVAEKYLSRANWDINRAVDIFFQENQGNSQPVVDKGSVDKAFQELADKGSDSIGMEGIQKILGQLGLEGEDLVVGYLYYLMKAKESCSIGRGEFNQLLNGTNSKNLSDLKKSIPKLRKDMNDKDTFRNLYMYVFELNRGDSKTLPFQYACAIWRLYLKDNFKLYNDFMAYLDSQPPNKKKPVNPDLWRMVLEFQTNTNGDLTKYKETDGWPVFIDDFVQFVRKKSETMEVEKV